MSKMAEERAFEAYPNECFIEEDYADMCRSFFIEGYEQAEKDLADVARFSSGLDGFFYGKGYQQAGKDLGWISVNDRLPEISGFYITCIEDNGVAQAVGVSFFNDQKEWEDDDDSFANVDYWMKIPELPEK